MATTGADRRRRIAQRSLTATRSLRSGSVCACPATRFPHHMKLSAPLRKVFASRLTAEDCAISIMMKLSPLTQSRLAAFAIHPDIQKFATTWLFKSTSNWRNLSALRQRLLDEYAVAFDRFVPFRIANVAESIDELRTRLAALAGAVLSPRLFDWQGLAQHILRRLNFEQLYLRGSATVFDLPQAISV